MITRTIEQSDEQDTVFMMAHEISRNDWEKLVDSLLDGGINLSRLSDIATSTSVIYAEIAEYLGARGANGCGDSGHEIAMKEVAHMRKHIRKALGYSYP